MSWCMELEIIHKAPNFHRQAMVVSENVAVPLAWIIGTTRSKTGLPAIGRWSALEEVIGFANKSKERFATSTRNSR